MERDDADENGRILKIEGQFIPRGDVPPSPLVVVCGGTGVGGVKVLRYVKPVGTRTAYDMKPQWMLPLQVGS